MYFFSFILSLCLKSIFLLILLLALKLTIFQEMKYICSISYCFKFSIRISGEQRYIERKIRSHLNHITYTRRMYKKSLLWRFLVRRWRFNNLVITHPWPSKTLITTSYDQFDFSTRSQVEPRPRKPPIILITVITIHELCIVTSM